jgi:N-acetylglucosamine transport system substrate-binding protein
MSDRAGRPADVSRRALLRNAAAAALVAGPAAGLLQACAGGGGGDSGGGGAQKSATNPFGVRDGDPLEVVIFKGGFGDDYAKYDEQMYARAFGKSQGKISHQGIQKIKTTLQPRFANGTPPDVIDNSGADQMANDGLYRDGQLTDLTQLLDAPSYDDQNTKVRDTLLPGTIAKGVFEDDKMVLLNYGFTVWGLWYSTKLFTDKGWQYPQTWDEFLALCATIKKAGIAPFIHQGKYPYYMAVPIMDLVYKNGGLDAALKIDNLEPGAWKQDAVKNAVEGIYQLVAKGYMYPGTEGLTHLESQTKWNQGQAAFIPCGSWLPNEQKDQTPAGFDMVVQAMPSLSTSDKLPYGTVRSGAGEPFIVPAKAKNRAGGLEFLRIMLSKEASRKFAELTQSLPCTKGGGEGLSGVTIKSENDAMSAAGDNIIDWKYLDWYNDLEKAIENATGELMANRYKPADWMNAMQQAADTIAKDPSVKKFTRSA